MQVEAFLRPAQPEPVLVPLPENITCSNSGCRNPDGRSLPRKWFIGDSRGRQTTFRTCSHCRAKDSQKKRQGRATSHENKHRIQDLENALATLTMENQRLKQEMLNSVPMSTIEEHIDSMMMTDVDDFTVLLDDTSQCAKRKREVETRQPTGTSVLSNCFNDQCSIPQLQDRLEAAGPANAFSEIMHYVSVGDAEMVIRLIDLGHDTLAKRENGCSSLHLAVKYQQKEIVPILLAATQYSGTSDINSPMSDDLNMLTGLRQTWVGVTPLHLVALTGDSEIAQVLLDAGAAHNRAAFTADGTHSQVTPLHVCASFGHVELCILLLERGADLKACMSLPCGTNGMANPGAYKLHRMPLQIAQGPTQQVLANWARLAAEHRSYSMEQSWLYTRLPAWTTKTHIQFPARFRQQAIALVLCNDRTMKEARDDVFPLMIKMIDVHNQEFIFGDGQFNSLDMKPIQKASNLPIQAIQQLQTQS